MAAAVAAFSLAGALAVELARPFRAGTAAFDSAVAVLYFERIVAGRQLESTITTLPKPLITVVYGLLHALTSDWRALSWAVIIAFALGVALATVVAYRVAGPIAAGFMAVGLGTAPQLLLDVGLALAWAWGLLFLSLAALALAQPRPRYGLAGLALAAGVLARFELSVVVIGMAAVLAVVTLLAWRSGRPPPWAPMRLLISVIALPILLIHDWLLIGNPLHWTTIADRYSRATASVPDLAEISGRILIRYADVAVVCLLAGIGVVWLYRAGRPWLAIGLLLLGPGVTAFLLVLAARGTFVDDRYFAAVDVAVVVAAACGMAIFRDRPRPMWAWLDGTPGVVRGVLTFGAGAFAAFVLTGAWAAFDPALRNLVRNQLALAIDTHAVLPTLQAFVDDNPASRSFVPASLDGSPLVLVPVKVRPHLAVDLELPLPEIGSTAGGLIDLEEGYPHPGQVVYHHLLGERNLAGFEVLRTSERVEIDGVEIVPLLVEEGRGYWVVSIEEP